MQPYSKEVLESLVSQGKKVVIKFHAPWCGTCKQTAPMFNSLDNKYPEVEFLECDTDKNPAASAKFNIQSLPTYFILEGDDKKSLTGPDALKNVIQALKG